MCRNLRIDARSIARSDIDNLIDFIRNAAQRFGASDSSGLQSRRHGHRSVTLTTSKSMVPSSDRATGGSGDSLIAIKPPSDEGNRHGD
jgi:hypothetical protein